MFTLTSRPRRLLSDHVWSGSRRGARSASPVRRAELVSFARIWFRNLRAQEFLGEHARREVIA